MLEKYVCLLLLKIEALYNVLYCLFETIVEEQLIEFLLLIRKEKRLQWAVQ